MSDDANPTTTTVHLAVYDTLADWETGLAAAYITNDGWQRRPGTARVVTVGLTREPVTTMAGTTIVPDIGVDELRPGDSAMLILPGADLWLTGDALAPFVGAARAFLDAGVPVAAICGATWGLAAAGLLDGRRATTHWRYADQLRERYPAIHVDPEPLYTDEGDVLTSAGCAAGLDLALHLVRKDLGAAVANAVARRMVIQPYRSGGQAQYIESPMPPDPVDAPVARSLGWALEHLAEPIGVPDLARAAGLSPRTYLRHFTRETGTTPAKWLIAQRIQAALAMLETGDAPVEEIALAAGFATPVTFRHHFAKSVRTSPSAYRRAFRARRG